MNLHEEHMRLVDRVNNAKTERDHLDAELILEGFGKGVSASGGNLGALIIEADLEQFRRGVPETRPMCGGTFNDWKPCY